MTSVIAICGPDGAGKSTLSNKLDLIGFETQYGGKKAGHRLFITTTACRFYTIIDRVFPTNYFSHIFLLIFFYPIEYIENIVRVKKAKETASQATPVCFDRFVVDRMWQSYMNASDLTFARRVFNKITGVYGYLYRNYFPSIDGYVFLVPTSDMLLERAPEHYCSETHASQVRSAYLSVATELQSKNENVLIIETKANPEKLLQETVEWVDEMIDYDESK